MLDILFEMKAQLASVETELRGVNVRLDKLNGSVANHAGRLNVIESHHNIEAGQKRANATWLKILWPILYAVGGGFIALIIRLSLENSQSVLKALPR